MTTASNATLDSLADLGTALAGLETAAESSVSLSPYQEALVAFGRRTTVQPSLAVLMQDAAILLAETLGAEWMGVGEVRRGQTIRLQISLVAAHGTEPTTEDQEWELTATDSMAAYCLRAARPAVSVDLAAETRFDDVFLRRLGVVAAVTIPLHWSGRPFGALGAYAGQVRNYTPDEVCVAETIGHLLTASIARIKAEEELRREKTTISTVLEMIDAMVLRLDMEGHVVHMNRACEETTHYTLDEIRGRPFWNVFAVPEEIDLVRRVFSASIGHGVPSEFAGYLLAKDGSRKHVSWSMKAMSDGLQSVLITGLDQTEQVQTKGELDRLRALAEQATRASKDRVEVGEPGSSTGVSPDRTEGVICLSELPASPAGRELRSNPRRDYPYRQRIAPMRDGLTPQQRDFFLVECKDISAGGIAFYMNRFPDFDILVVALGCPPKVSHFTARMLRVARVEENGRIRYLVGCRFLGRIRL